MPDPSSMNLRTFMVEITNVIATTGLTLSPSMFSATSTPRGLTDRSYVVNLRSRDTAKYRNGGDSIMRMEHVLTVQVAKKIKPHDQFASQLESMDIQESLIAALQKSGALTYARVDWVSTRSPVSPSREWIIIEMAFKVEHDWTWAPA